MSYLNTNGLVDGNIPANKPCPFYAECKRKTGYCPSETNLLAHTFSCALARLNSIILVSDNSLLKAVRDKV